ncbi:MAG: hypothetical protein A3G25_12700 [Betaproteobacteria bacterium RIFCSPLOWO2_12_FULL_63_13]|nr:MAG: hypothetical protein A3G25_12700 [Betaproteobacteria bacterium RIFCSPLOWO2_12_FULL_63_13]
MFLSEFGIVDSAINTLECVVAIQWKHCICLVWFCAIAASGNATTPMVSLGSQHALALRSDGAVVSWGSDESGQLGAGRLPYETRPGMVVGLSGVRSIASGVNHSLAVRSDGTVWAWGNNYDGQLGNGSTVNTSTPALVRGLDDVVQACGGAEYSLALRQDGSVWAWGGNYHGTLADGTQDNSLAPRKIADLSSIDKVACGSTHALALRSDGRVLAWGSNAEGALGDGSKTDRLRPVEVSGLAGVGELAAGEDFSVALTQDGVVWEWGVVAPYSTPRDAPRVYPVRAAGISGVTAIAGSINSFAISAINVDSRTWWRWTTGSAPISQSRVGELKSVAAGYGQTLLLKTNGTVLSLGDNGNGFGNLGDGTTDYRDTPGPVVDISEIVQVAAGSWHGLALDATGNVWSWGLDSSGQLGQGRFLSSAVPAVVIGLEGVVQVSAGYSHSLALDRDGTVWAWGSNGYAELGDGSYQDSGTPVRLTAITDVQAIAAGPLYSLALKRDGTVWGWGSTFPGQSEDPSVPSFVLDNAVAIAAGDGHSLALDRDGTVWAWGGNNQGQLGDGTTVDRRQPAKVPGLSSVMAIAATSSNSYALKSDGTVLGWGENSRGQIGDGSTTRRLTPTLITGLDHVVEFRAGTSHALARRTNGSIWGWSWGYELAGELGSDPALSISTPAPLTVGVDAITTMAVGDATSAFVRQDGSVYMGGRNVAGQLGDGTFAKQATIVAVINETFNGFLDLDPSAANLPVPVDKVPPFLLATYREGGVNSTSLHADLRGITASGIFASARDYGNFAAGYNVYVAANIPNLASSPYFQLSANNSWTVLKWPMAPFLTSVALDSQASVVRTQILQNADLSSPVFAGASIIVGYGTDPDEMLRSARYRTIFSVPQP